MNEVALSERPTAAHSSYWRRLDHKRLVRLLPGLGLSVLLALTAMQLGTIGWLASHGISALTAAIALGILVGNTLYPRVAATAGVGIAFSKQTLLRKRCVRDVVYVDGPMCSAARSGAASKCCFYRRGVSSASMLAG